jgi:hypothetical protein
MDLYLRPTDSEEDAAMIAGECPRCHVRCAGSPADREKLEEVLRVHRLHCPGGDRSDELWRPFGARRPRS